MSFLDENGLSLLWNKIVSRITAINSRIDNLVVNAGGNNVTEVVDARVDRYGANKGSLKARLDNDSETLQGLIAGLSSISSYKKNIYQTVANGSFNVYGSFTTNSARIRTEAIPFKKGDVIIIENGDLSHACGVWEKTLSNSTNKRNDGTFSSKIEILSFDYDGFIIVVFRNATNTNLSYANTSCSVSVLTPYSVAIANLRSDVIDEYRVLTKLAPGSMDGEPPYINGMTNRIHIVDGLNDFIPFTAGTEFIIESGTFEYIWRTYKGESISNAIQVDHINWAAPGKTTISFDYDGYICIAFRVSETASNALDPAAFNGQVSMSTNYHKTANILREYDKTKIQMNAPLYESICTSINRIAMISGVPMQTIPGYKKAFALGFRSLLCDIRFTSDNVCVCYHDNYLNEVYSTVYNSSGSLVSKTNPVYINATTYAALQAYDFGRYAGDEFIGTKILSFEEFARFCSNTGCDMYLEMKGTLTSTQYKKVFDTIDKYGMRERTVWCPQNATELNNLIAYNPNVYISYHTNLSAGQSLTVNHVNTLVNAKNDYNKDHLSISCSTSAVLSADVAELLNSNGIKLLSGTFSTVDSVDAYLAKGAPYTMMKLALTNTVVVGKRMFELEI